MADAIMRERERETKAAMKNAAFTAYLMGAGGKIGWLDFCANAGLAEKRVSTKEQRQSEIKRAYEIADRTEIAIQKGKK